MARKRDERFQWSREAQRVQVLGHGHAVRIFDHTGCAWTLISSDLGVAANLQRLLAMIGDEDAECRERIYDQLPVEWQERADRKLSIDDEDVIVVSPVPDGTNGEQ